MNLFRKLYLANRQIVFQPSFDSERRAYFFSEKAKLEQGDQFSYFEINS